MIVRMKVALLATTAALVLGAGSSAASARPQTTAPNIFVQIHVTITDTKVTLSPKTAPRGTDAQFIIRNAGSKPHTFTLGTTNRGQGVQTGFQRRVAPGKRQMLLLYLNYRGALPYHTDLAGDRGGKFVIGADVTGSVDH
jgi:hypothetical protein